MPPPPPSPYTPCSSILYSKSSIRASSDPPRQAGNPHTPATFVAVVNILSARARSLRSTLMPPPSLCDSLPWNCGHATSALLSIPSPPEPEARDTRPEVSVHFCLCSRAWRGADSGRRHLV
ncbi:unknown protein [Oryza sativa Japonica Group]|uniref:Os01g0258000 protein n=3 Tax=Oryza TaxID=4527 RepID=B7F1S3_ORYSJ|nr:unknown protein [Oryza sativa Japonica Group]BAF04549.1 Os01g0258000 [Oryza sativa Japonica Group]BAG98570.1 unnamed protein product [Oryza sativa Japonica Group]|eukprot:NP_001042635.1 Os01g0258000 [Oryza sativa Japonica Group]